MCVCAQVTKNSTASEGCTTKDGRGNGFLVEEKSEAVEANLPHGCSKSPKCLHNNSSFVGLLEGKEEMYGGPVGGIWCTANEFDSVNELDSSLWIASCLSVYSCYHRHSLSLSLSLSLFLFLFLSLSLTHSLTLSLSLSLSIYLLVLVKLLRHVYEGRGDSLRGSTYPWSRPTYREGSSPRTRCVSLHLLLSFSLPLSFSVSILISHVLLLSSCTNIVIYLGKGLC